MKYDLIENHVESVSEKKKELIEYIKQHGWTSIIEKATSDKTIAELKDMRSQIDNFRSDERHGY